MNRPYIICHMVTSIDGKVTGDFLFRSECEMATEIYYEMNRSYKADGFICGRVTMEGSFTNGWYPDLTQYAPIEQEDYIPTKEALSGFYAVAFDPKGRLGWKSNRIVDEDPGYGNAQIIEVLTKQADPRYLGYLKSMGIPYIFAGEKEIDVQSALFKLKNAMGINTLLLEGGSVVNGYFLRADAVDELSLVVSPMIAEGSDKPLFTDSAVSDYKLKEIKQYEKGVVWMNYIK
ncbi:MAG: RibD family protein [Clostridia bacterium]|nr:RibD family protein [Clostridia bacterium]